MGKRKNFSTDSMDDSEQSSSNTLIFINKFPENEKDPSLYFSTYYDGKLQEYE